MKKLIMLITILLGVQSTFGQDLNENAKLLRKGETTKVYYDCIKTQAVAKWKDDHRMNLYTINQQADALMEYFTMIKKYPKDSSERNILVKAAMKWSDGDQSLCKTDWKMAVYAAKGQLEAMNKY